MARIDLVDPQEATGQSRELLAAVDRKFGAVPNTFRAMAGSAVLEGYLGFLDGLGKGRIGGAVAERIALAVAESNACSYCLSAHSYVAEHVAKLDGPEIEAARHFRSTDPHAAAALKFAEAVVATRGAVSDADLSAARQAGLSDDQLSEVVGHVALNFLTNYFNKAFDVDVDFPPVHPHAHAAAV
jgi:uncharacterized peroxidase-related enzyme